MVTDISFLSQQELQTRRIEIYSLLKDYSTRHLHQVLGLTSTYINALCDRAKVIGRAVVDGKIRRTVDAQKVRELAAACQTGKVSFTTTVLWTSEYLQKNWPQAPYGPESIRAMRFKLSQDFGLFTFAPQEKGATTQPPDLQGADLVQMLLVAELAEWEICYRFQPKEGRYRALTEEEKKITGDVTFLGYISGQTELDCLPFHKNGFVATVFNALFDGVLKYHREVANQDVLILNLPSVEPSEVVVVPAIAPKWKKHFKLGRKAWNTVSQRPKELEMFKEWCTATNDNDILQYCRSFLIAHPHCVPF